MHGRGNSYPPHVRRINDAFPGLRPLRFRRLPLVRQRQQYDCCQLILSCPFLGGQAPPPAYPASTPPSKPVQPHIGDFFGYCSNTRGKSVQPHEGLARCATFGNSVVREGLARCATLGNSVVRERLARCAILGNSVVREGLAHCAILGNSTAHKVFARCAHTTHGNIYICVGEGDPPPRRKLISRRDRPASPAPDTSRPGCPR